MAKGEKKDPEIVKPMATAVPTLEEEIAALKMRIAILEHNCLSSHGRRQPVVFRHE